MPLDRHFFSKAILLTWVDLYYSMMSSEYPMVLSGATVGNLEDPGTPLKGDSYWCRVSQELAVVVSLAELLWVKRSIISVRAEICACKGSRLAFILSSTKFGKNFMLLSSLPSVASASTFHVTSSYADISKSAFESYEFPFLNFLKL